LYSIQAYRFPAGRVISAIKIDPARIIKGFCLLSELSQLAGYNLYGKEEVPAGGIITGI
jgi:hypothetical protein